MNKKYLFSFLILLVIIFFVVAFRNLYKKNQENKLMDASNAVLFQTLLLDPVPESIKNLKGLGYQENTRDTYFQFDADESVVQKLLALHDYKKEDCNDKTIFQSLFAPSKDQNNPWAIRQWKIQRAKNPVCYTTLIFNEAGIQGKFYSDKMRQKARSEFLFDQETGKIYFHEEGI